MKRHHLLNLIQDNYTTIRVVFNDDTRRGYTYKAPLAAGVVENDFVVVDSPHSGLVTARVIKVDERPKIDLDADYGYKWIVQKVDRTQYDETVDRERRFLQEMADIELQRAREKLLEDIQGEYASPALKAMFEKAQSNLLEGECKTDE